MVKEKILVLCNITFVLPLKFRLVTNLDSNPADIYLFKVKNGDSRTICEICSKLIIKITERRYWPHPGVFIFNFEQISQINQLFPLLSLNN